MMLILLVDACAANVDVSGQSDGRDASDNASDEDDKTYINVAY